MHNNTFVSSHFETWKECKAKYHLKYIQKLHLPEKQNDFELGRNVHALANYYLKGFDINLFEKTLDETTAKHWFAIKNHKILSNNLICTEWGFNSMINRSGYWLNGRIDAVFYDTKKKKYIIVDWKTGQNIPSNQEERFQTKIYLYSFFKAQQDLGISLKQNELSFIYIKTPGGEISEPINYSQEKEIEYETEFIKVIKDIESFNFNKLVPNYNSKVCNYCQYLEICQNSFSK